MAAYFKFKITPTNDHSPTLTSNDWTDNVIQTPVKAQPADLLHGVVTVMATKYQYRA